MFHLLKQVLMQVLVRSNVLIRGVFARYLRPTCSETKLPFWFWTRLTPRSFLSGMLTTNRRTMVRASRRLGKVGYAFLLLVLLHASGFLFTMSMLQVNSRKSCRLQLPDSLTATWVGTRTEFFSAHWSSHKARNAALYLCIGMRHVPVLRSVTYHILFCPDVIYDARYDELFQVPSVCVTHKCLDRFGRSHYIYAEFVLKTYDKILSVQLSPPTPTTGGKIAVLLEPRVNPLYEYTVKQVMQTLGETWALHLFVSTKNEREVRRMFDVKADGKGKHILITTLAEFGLDDMSILGNRIQSAFSAHEVLYHTIPSEHILWFQLDVLMRAPPHDQWLQYAYVGSEWQYCQFPKCGLRCPAVCGGGNSGLSLRRKSSLLTVATRGTLPEGLWGSNSNHSLGDMDGHFSSDELHDNSKHRWFEDDLQISYKLSKLGILPPGNIPPRFAISQALPSEGLCTVSPAGMHKPWMTPWIDPHDIIWLLEAPFIALENPK